MANIEELNIVISGEASEAIKSVDEVKKALDSVKDTNVKVTVDTAQATDEVSKLADTVGRIGDTHVEITASGSQAVDEAAKTANAVQSVTDAHVDITADGSQAVDEANKVASAEESITGANSEITADGSQAISALQEVAQFIATIDGKTVTFSVKPNVDNIASGMQKQFETAGEGAGGLFASGLEKGIENVLKNIKTTSILKEKFAALQDYQSRFEEFADVAEEANDKFESGFGSMLTGIVAKFTAVAGSITVLAKNALAIGGGFESQMTTVKSISGATEEELEALTKKAREMGSALPISAKDAAMAMTLLAQRGTSAKNILATVDEVANLVISQGVDMGSAADLLGSTMTNFGISIDDAAKVTAIFNNACNQSALSMSKLIEAMKYVGPAAGAVNMSITEAVAAMEAVVNAGLTGEMTGTGLANVLSKLAAKSNIMGVSTKNLDGSMRPLRDIFSELKDKGFSLADAIEAFGQSGSKVALALTKNSDTLAENEEKLKDWGTTQAAVDEKAKTFPNTMAAFQSAVEDLHLEIFDQIKEKSKEIVSGLADLVRVTSAWMEKTQLASGAFNALLEGFGIEVPSIEELQSLLDEFDTEEFIENIKSFASGMKQIAKTIADVAEIIAIPINFIIDHLDIFAHLTFWGWILDKAMYVPRAILNIADSLRAVYNVIKLFNANLLAPLMSLLATPLGAGIAAAVGVWAIAEYAASKEKEARAARYQANIEAAKLRQEIKKANEDLQFKVSVDFETGFEALPASYAKASDEVKQEITETVFFMQEQFRDKAAQAVEFVTAKFPEMADAFHGTANDISDDVLSQISAALHGSEKDFEALPEIWRKVAERINAVDTGFDKLGIDLLGVTEKYRDLQSAIEKPIKQSETAVFIEDITTQIKEIVASVPEAVNRINTFLSSSDGQLAVQVSVAQAQSKLSKFVKTVAEKYKLPEEIVSSELFNRLEALARTGDKTAQSLINGWKDNSTALDTFLGNARDAIAYLGASPDEFLPALRSLMDSIQKVDPLTGKVTEGFKKAYETLKQWGNITFDGLMSRLAMLNKAFEGGFLRRERLIEQIQAAIPKIELQIVKDLYPQRELFGGQENFLAVVASEFAHKIADTFGDIGTKYLQDRFGETEGATVGSWIVNSVKGQLGVDKIPYGRSERADTELADALQNLTQAVSDARKATLQGAETATQRTNTSAQPSAQPSAQRGEKDYSAAIGQISQDVGKLLASVQGVTGAVNGGVATLVSTMTSISNNSSNNGSGNSNDNTEATNFQNIISALIDNTSALGRTSDAVLSLVNSASSGTTADYSPDFSLIVGSLQALGGSIDALKNSTDSNVSALSQFQGSLASGVASPVPQDFSGALSPVTTALQNISNGIASVQGVVQANVTAVNAVGNAVNAVESAVKAQQHQAVSLDQTAISQAVTAGVTPLLGALQTVSASVSAVQTAAQENVQAVRSVESAVKATSVTGSTVDISSAINPLTSAVQNLSATLTTIQALQQANASALSDVLNAVRSVESALKSMNAGNSYDIDINQQGFMIEKKSDADMLARSTVNALRAGIGNGGI